MGCGGSRQVLTVETTSQPVHTTAQSPANPEVGSSSSPNVDHQKPAQIESTAAENLQEKHSQADESRTDQETVVDQPQTSAPEKGNETEPREDPLGAESREIVQEIPAENVEDKKADNDQEPVNQPEASKDEGAVEESQAVDESTAPKDEGNQQVRESEEEAGTSAENSGGDKTDGEHAGEQGETEKPAEQSAVNEGETQAQKESESTTQVDEEKPTEGENADETQPAAEESKPADEEAHPAGSESQPPAEESSPAAEEPQTEEPSAAEEGQKSEDAQPQEETPANEES